MAITDNNVLHITRFSSLTKWSAHDAVFENMDNRFPLVPLSKVLKRVKEPVNIDDDTLYKRITVRLYGQGVLQRDELLGKEIGTKRQFLAHYGQLIISRIDARNGAFGIVPPELEGAIVTNDFWLFDVMSALPEYLMLVLSSDLFQKYWQTQSSGTTNRQRVSEDSFLASKIALPDFDTQKKLMEKYLAKHRNAELSDLQVQNTLTDINSLLFSELGIEERKPEGNSTPICFVAFSNLYQWGVDKNTALFPYEFRKYKAFSFISRPTWIKTILRGKSPKYSADSKSIILNQKCNRTDYIDLSFAKTVDADWLKKFDTEFLTREGDIIINSTGEGTLGRASLITKEYEGLAYDSHVLLLRVNKTEVDPQLIVDLINSPFGQKQVELYKSAQATKQTELGVDNTKRFLFPLPVLPEQKRISAAVEEKKKKIVALCKESESLRLQATKDFEAAVFGLAMS